MRIEEMGWRFDAVLGSKAARRPEMRRQILLCGFAS